MMDFLIENCEWLFSGIGVTVLVWILGEVKKKMEKHKFIGKTASKFMARRNGVKPRYMEIVKEDNSTELVEVLVSFEFTDTKQEFVVYTRNETDKYGNVTVYVSRVVRSGAEVTLMDVRDGLEWKRVREALVIMADADPKQQPLFDEEGIEII